MGRVSGEKKNKDSKGKSKVVDKKDSGSKLTPYEQEMLETYRKVKEYSLNSEANVVLLIYKNPELLYNYKLTLEDFHNNTWKVYFSIGQDLILKEKKTTLDEISIGLYLSKHPKLQEKYEEYGGYDVITNGSEYIQESNFSSYYNELKKWGVVLKLLKMKFPITDRLSEIVDMSAEQIYNEYEAKLQHLFINIDSEVKSYSITEGLDELIDELDAGLAVGLPYNDMPMLTKETSGMQLGNITLVGGLSNCGKSTFARNLLIPSILKHGEKIVVILNEENLKRWQRELIVFVANNILKKELQKYVVRDGKYSDETKEIIKDAVNWIKEKAADNTITIIPFEKYSTQKAIKVIKKYASLGNVKYFVLDTFKMDAGKVSEQSWLEMAQSMVAINDTIKEDCLNVHILITFQLAKASARQRFYMQDNVGVSKSIIDPVSTCIMIRDVFEDEVAGGKRELRVFRLEGKNKTSKIPVVLDKNKRYQLVFIVKNREGAANSRQLVIESDMSRNIVREIGVTVVPADF